ncbi:ANK_REP_REGION domain-containing protein [Durusdinium trenchii]|uniref:ANK_REP_REGION domain-containing protein n=1 Tax=Durusdinium trenchii TaxID=1381693 RepID=A0ABP0HYJ6_9DINO
MAVASDEKYVPGKGLDRSANARLRARQAGQQRQRAKDVESELPGKDTSAQTDFLLGNGAQKVARCGKCTRPLDAAAVDAKVFVCSRCEPGGGVSDPPRNHHNHPKILVSASLWIHIPSEKVIGDKLFQ